MGVVSAPTPRIFITGANGLLGQKLVAQCQEKQLGFLASSSGQNVNPKLKDSNYVCLDITDANSLLKHLDNYRPTCIINTAAITNVDLCESIEEDCFNVNATAVEAMMKWCAKNDCHFIQISTDFIFDGKKEVYSEDEQPRPLSVYGLSKLRAEEGITTSAYPNWTILRTSVVYGSAHSLKRSNLVLWVRGELLRNRTVSIVDDQFRAPTWADDLAKAALTAAVKQKFGIFNIVGPQCMSMFEFVQRICRFYKQPLELVKQIKTSDLQQVAERPLKTNMLIDKAKVELDYEPLTIEETLTILEKEIPLHTQ